MKYKQNNISPKVTFKSNKGIIKQSQSLFSDLKILALDDNKLNLKYYGNLFKNVFLFSEPSMAIREIKKNDYDIIILEYFFQKCTGLDILNEIQKEKTNKELVSLLITNSNLGISYGALNSFTSYLFKPVAPREIYDEINLIL